MTTEPRKHHYIPQSILRCFSIGGKRRNVFVFDKVKQRCFSLPIPDAGAERDFYRFEINGVDVNLETLFDTLDTRLANLVAKIAEDRSIALLTAEERYDLTIVTACQLLRTKILRTSAVEIGRQLTQRLQEKDIDLRVELTNSQSRLISLSRLLDLGPTADLLANKDILLIISHETNLWTSDNPVVFHNTFPYGRAALKAPGVEIYYPLTADLCLAFLCPSFKEMLTESFDPLHPRPTIKDPLMANVLKSLKDYTPVEYPASNSIFLNSLQVYNSSRFLFGSEDNFDLARKAICEHPNLQEVLTLTNVGELGSPPPPNRNMPVGDWLVVESGHRHHAFPVELLNEGSWTIDFTTTDLVKLATIEQDAPFDCVTVYQDGRQSRMIRDVMFCHIEVAERRFVRIQHPDESMNAVMEQINRNEA